MDGTKISKDHVDYRLDVPARLSFRGLPLAQYEIASPHVAEGLSRAD